MNSTMNRRDPLAQEWPVRCVLYALDQVGDAAGEAAGSFSSGLKAALAGANIEWATDLEAAFQSEGQDRVLVLARAPVTSLATALAASEDPDTTLEQWIGIREALLARFARARRKVTIMDIGLFARRDAEAWALICQRLGIDPAQHVPAIAAPSDLRVAPVHEIAAAALIRRDPRAARIAEALQVATIGAEAAEPSVAPVFALLGDWRETETRLALMAENVQTHLRAGAEALDETARARARDESALLRENVMLQAQSNEALAADNAGLRVNVDRLKGQLRNEVLLQATIEALEHRLATQEATALRDRAILGATLLADARATRALEADRNEVAGALAEAKERLTAIGTMMDGEARNKAALQAELARVFRSRSWRLTAPLRAARFRLGPKPRT